MNFYLIWIKSKIFINYIAIYTYIWYNNIKEPQFVKERKKYYVREKNSNH